MVLRLLGLSRLPDVATLSSALAQIDSRALDRLRERSRDLVQLRLAWLLPLRITLDFDGSVQGTSRHAKGAAVGYNRCKKGQRSYYPLFCTVAQTGQVEVLPMVVPRPMRILTHSHFFLGHCTSELSRR